MIIYEQGFSVAQKLNNVKDISYKTYVYVDENLESTSLKDAFDNMKNYLLNNIKLNIKEYNFENLQIEDVNDNIYNLSVEKTFNDKKKLVITPSNLYRHLSTQDFTLEKLYINEDGVIINLFKDCEKHIKSKDLRDNINFSLNYQTNNNLLLKLINYVSSGYSINSYIDDKLYYEKCLNFPKDLIKLKKVALVDFYRFYNFCNNYPNIKKVFQNTVGINFDFYKIDVNELKNIEDLKGVINNGFFGKLKIKDADNNF